MNAYTATLLRLRSTLTEDLSITVDDTGFAGVLTRELGHVLHRHQIQQIASGRANGTPGAAGAGWGTSRAVASTGQLSTAFGLCVRRYLSLMEYFRWNSPKDFPPFFWKLKCMGMYFPTPSLRRSSAT